MKNNIYQSIKGELSQMIFDNETSLSSSWLPHSSIGFSCLASDNRHYSEHY